MMRLLKALGILDKDSFFFIIIVRQCYRLILCSICHNDGGLSARILCDIDASVSVFKLIWMADERFGSLLFVNHSKPSQLVDSISGFFFVLRFRRFTNFSVAETLMTNRQLCPKCMGNETAADVFIFSIWFEFREVSVLILIWQNNQAWNGAFI